MISPCPPGQVADCTQDSRYKAMQVGLGTEVFFMLLLSVRDTTLITAGGAPKTVGGGSQNFTTLFRGGHKIMGSN